MLPFVEDSLLTSHVDISAMARLQLISPKKKTPIGFVNKLHNFSHQENLYIFCELLSFYTIINSWNSKVQSLNIS